MSWRGNPLRHSSQIRKAWRKAEHMDQVAATRMYGDHFLLRKSVKLSYQAEVWTVFSAIANRNFNRSIRLISSVQLLYRQVSLHSSAYGFKDRSMLKLGCSAASLH